MTNITTIQSVTIFPDRARVTRHGHHALETGVQKVEIDNLPLVLVQDSVRASGRGTARVKLLGVSTRLEHFTETPAEAVRALEQKIQAAEDADNDLLARIGVLEKEQKYLEGLAAQSEMFARGLALRERTPETQGAFFDFVTQRGLALQTEILKLQRDRRELAKELNRLRRELQTAQSARPRQRYVAMVELDVAQAGDFDLELTYVVTGAGWSPLYDLRLVVNKLDVTYLAQVAQNTGEDWPNVALTLSTAQPALALIIPKLSPWYIQPRRPLPPPQAKAMVMRSAPLAVAPAPAIRQEQAGAVPDAELFSAQTIEELAIDSAAVSEAGAALTYTLPARADIPGNNDPRKVTVAVFGLDPLFDYVTAPKVEPVCYRRATVKNTSPYSLLAGQAQLFEGDEYLGATQIEFVAPNQEFELALGADERLRVARELVNRDVDKAFILGDRRKIRYAYTIKLENLRDGPQVIFVRDQLPVPRDEQIKVKLEAADPKPAEQTELNQLEWKLTLDKGGKQTVRFDYSVEHPRPMDVVGLA